MALINCPECQRQISDQGVSCPGCGFPIKTQASSFRPNPSSFQPLPNVKDKKKDKNFVSPVFTLITICLAIWFFYSFFTSINKFVPEAQKLQSENGTAVSESLPINIETTASKMIATYANNEVRADAIYMDKVIKITGYVSSISSDVSNNAVVHLAPKGTEYEFTSVYATGDTNFHNQAINLQKNQKITLVCIGAGEIIASPMLKDCRFA